MHKRAQIGRKKDRKKNNQRITRDGIVCDFCAYIQYLQSIYICNISSLAETTQCYANHNTNLVKNLAFK